MTHRYFKNPLLTFAISLLLAGSVLGQFERPVIREIRIRGNEITEESLIRFQCGLEEGTRLQPDDPGTAIRNLYSLGLFADIKLFADTNDAGGFVLIIEVREHPQLSELVFEGNKAIKSKKLKKEVGFIRGETIEPQAIVRAEQSVLEAYREKGYNLARLEVEEGPADEEGRRQLIFRIVEGPKVNLKRITFEGNTAFSDGKLRSKMEDTKQDGWWFGGGKFNAKTYEEDKDKILLWYQQNGYREVEVVSDSLYFDASGKDLFVMIRLDEGPLYTFGEVTWEGNESLPDIAFQTLIVSKKGFVYSTERTQKSIEQLRNAYLDIGYLAANIGKTEHPQDGHIVDVNYFVDENDPWKVREIVIAGNTKTKDRVIRRELWIQPGDVFARSKIERSVRNLMQLNYFNTVEPDLRTNEETSEIDLILQVDERQTGTASIGAGFSERDKLVGTIGLQIPNFLGNGQQIDFQWEFGTQRETFVLGFTEPWMFNTPTSLSAQLFRTTSRFFSDFDQRSQGGTIRIGRRLHWPDFSSVSTGYTLSQIKFLNIRDSSRVDDPSLRDNVTSSITMSFQRDSRDLPIFPTSGSVFSYRPEIAGGVLQGNVNFHKHDFTASFNFPVFWKFALNLRSTLGVVVGYGNSTVPFSELYTPGGVDLFDRTMLRGYADRSVGPRNANRAAIGGNSQLLFNAELSIPIAPNQFYGLIFADAGNAWDNQSKISMFDVRRSVGFGIRIVAPLLGIMGFDFAWGLDRELVDGQPTSMITHFQFGPQFF